MIYNVVAIRTDGSGFLNITAGIDDESKAARQADNLNLGSLYVMGSDKPGAERAIPDNIYAAGYGPEALSANGELVAPYHGEISHSTGQIARMAAERIEKFGAEGVVRFSAFEAAQNIEARSTPDDKRSALASIFDDVRRGAEIAAKSPSVRPAPQNPLTQKPVF